MFTSSAVVYRRRQVVSDLTSYVSTHGRSAFRRISSGDGADALLDRILFGQSGRLLTPSDDSLQGEVQLAAALPDEDFPAFTCATALLLLDRLTGGAGEDDLFWNWDAFADHYRLADPAIRAVLMNGFRSAAELGLASVAEKPDPADCLTNPAEKVLEALRKEKRDDLVAAITGDVLSSEAAVLWLELSKHQPTAAVLAGVRYLYERPASLAPSDPEKTPLIPWAQ